MNILWLLLLALSGEPLKVAVLPCQHQVEATAKDAAWLDSKLLDELGSMVELVGRPAVLDAISKQNIKDLSSCDDACLTEIGKRLGADRVVSQTLSLQKKIQSEGTVWIWGVHQVDVKTAKAFGHFEKVCICSSPTWWDIIARQHARNLVEFDPAKRLELTKPEKAQPTKGPIDIPGMVYVPAGEFIMGSELGQFDEEPRHKVYLDAFYIDKYETTNEEYGLCVNAGKCVRQAVSASAFLDPRQPVVAVGWYDALAYCAFAGKRVPTEAEWEKAARGTDERRYPWGNEWHPEWVNMHHSDDGFEFTAPVGSFPKNVSPYGAYDMAGNAWEWTYDFHGEDYYKNSDAKNPKGPQSGERHVMRGGSWMYDVPFFTTTYNRSPGRPWIRKKYVGFRCAKNAP
jgi:formylglycine-generating enzyme required for sulfatase activity